MPTGISKLAMTVAQLLKPTILQIGLGVIAQDNFYIREPQISWLTAHVAKLFGRGDRRCSRSLIGHMIGVSIVTQETLISSCCSLEVR